jgi:hypothetical protein
VEVKEDLVHPEAIGELRSSILLSMELRLKLPQMTHRGPNMSKLAMVLIRKRIWGSKSNEARQ